MAALLALTLCGAIQAQAQRATGTGNRGNTGNRGGGGGGFGGGGGASFGSTGNRSYTPNGTVGEALISADPETRRLIVITDDETSRFISQVITNLDKPKPQQVIDCVKSLENLDFTDAELAEIDTYANDANINLWAASAERRGPERTPPKLA